MTARQTLKNFGWPEPPTRFRYTLKNTGHSSARYGVCEVCNEEVTEVWHQVEERYFAAGWTRFDTQDLFGHKNCLLSRQCNQNSAGA